MKKTEKEYVIVWGTLYKRGLSIPILRFLGKEKAYYALLEVHKWMVGKHFGVVALAKKVRRAGYFWPTMVQDAQEYVKK